MGSLRQGLWLLLVLLGSLVSVAPGYALPWQEFCKDAPNPYPYGPDPATTFRGDVDISPATIAVHDVAVHPDGRTLALSSYVGTYIFTTLPLQYQHATLCNTATDAHQPSSLRAPLFTWSPSAAFYAIYHDACVGVQVFDARTLALVQTMGVLSDDPTCLPRAHDELFAYNRIGTVLRLLWSPDEQHIAVMGDFMPLRVWHVPTGQIVLEHQLDNTAVGVYPALPVAWALDGSALLYAYNCVVDRWVVGTAAFAPWLTDLCHGAELPTTEGNPARRYNASLGLSSQNRLAVSYFWFPDVPLVILDATSGESIAHSDVAGSHVVWSPDGERLLVANDITGHPDTPFQYVTHLNAAGEVLLREPVLPIPREWWLRRMRVTRIVWHPSGRHYYLLANDGLINDVPSVATRLSMRAYDGGIMWAELTSCAAWRIQIPNFDCASLTQVPGFYATD